MLDAHGRQETPPYMMTRWYYDGNLTPTMRLRGEYMERLMGTTWRDAVTLSNAFDRPSAYADLVKDSLKVHLDRYYPTSEYESQEAFFLYTVGIVGGLDAYYTKYQCQNHFMHATVLKDAHELAINLVLKHFSRA